MENRIEIFQTIDGIQVNVLFNEDSVWLTQKQMAQLFTTTTQNITLHLKNLYAEAEIEEQATCKEYLQVQKEGERLVRRKQLIYNLDAILSLGYRINSKKGTYFRKWATLRLKEYLIEGFSINKNKLKENKIEFIKTIETLKSLTENNSDIKSNDILSIIQLFSETWFALDNYDKQEFPKEGIINNIEFSEIELYEDLQILKNELIKRREATELFAQEKKSGSFKGIFGNVFQSIFGQDAYPTIEDKAAHLIYFIIKNHPFNDGNKRSGAFSFIWFLNKCGYPISVKITPETLTTLTILIAESNPIDKEKIIGVIMLILKIH